jgi:hypothetical protein
MRMMKVARDQIVDVIAVGNRLMSAARRVRMVLQVARAAMGRRARRRIRGVDLESALVDVSVVAVVEMAIVQVVDVISVADRDVAAARTVDVIVVRVRVVAHALLPFFGPGRTTAASPT